MSIIQTTATTRLGAPGRRPAVTPREVRPARRQLSGLRRTALTLDGRACRIATAGGSVTALLCCGSIAIGIAAYASAAHLGY